jgi:hypothetical protein
MAGVGLTGAWCLAPVLWQMCQDLGDKVCGGAETCHADPLPPALARSVHVAWPAGGARSTVELEGRDEHETDCSSEVAAAASAACLPDTRPPLMRTLVVPVLPLGYSLVADSAVSSVPSCDGAVEATSPSCVGCCRHSVLYEAGPEHVEGAAQDEAAGGTALAQPTCGLWRHWRASACRSDKHAAPTIAEAWQLWDAGQHVASAEPDVGASAEPALDSGAALLVRPDGYVAWRHRGDPRALTPSCPPLIKLARILEGPASA